MSKEAWLSTPADSGQDREARALPMVTFRCQSLSFFFCCARGALTPRSLGFC